MKTLITFVVLLALIALGAVLGAAAQAKPAPLELRPVAFSADDSTINTGASGASLESEYFRALKHGSLEITEASQAQPSITEVIDHIQRRQVRSSVTLERGAGSPSGKYTIS